MNKQVKKLPAVWVGFDAKGLAWTTKSKPTAGDYKFVGEFHKYVPAKPARICEWYRITCGSETEIWKNCEGEWYGDDPYAYCPLCGKLVREVGK